MKAGSFRRLDVAMHAAPLRKTAGSRGMAGRGAAGGLVIGVSPDVKIRGVAGYPSGLPIDGPLITELSNSSKCSKVREMSVVEIRHRDEILKELAVQRSRYSDPATRVLPHLLTPGYMVQGGGTRAAPGTFDVQVHLVNLSTGKTVASARASGPNLFDTVDSLAGRLAASICEPPKEEFPAQYTILAARLQMHTQASQTTGTGICDEVGGFAGSRDFVGALQAPLNRPTAHVEKGPAGSSGDFHVKCPAKWNESPLERLQANR